MLSEVCSCSTVRRSKKFPPSSSLARENLWFVLTDISMMLCSSKQSGVREATGNSGAHCHIIPDSEVPLDCTLSPLRAPTLFTQCLIFLVVLRGRKRENIYISIILHFFLK